MRYEISFSQFFTTLAYFFVLSLCLGGLYHLLSGWGSLPWLAILIFNTVLAIVVLKFTPAFKTVSNQSRIHDFFASPIRLLAPAIVVVLGSVLIALITSERIQPLERERWSFLIATCIWVPIVEEIIFRRGFGSFFRKLSGPIWGAYFSALLFAVVHTQPTLGRILAGEVGVPLGPFFLGLAVEALYSFSGQKLWPCIMLHAACNLSVVIFTVIDPRWLEWLSLLYT
ncbi:CPBP family intramembrane metalloprotease [Oligoflexaceae bacterium]|nr:CPBP family intramembrane metalloprotease [Oligoflexaceae bacterium]